MHVKLMVLLSLLMLPPVQASWPDFTSSAGKLFSEKEDSARLKKFLEGERQIRIKGHRFHDAVIEEEGKQGSRHCRFVMSYFEEKDWIDLNCTDLESEGWLPIDTQNAKLKIQQHRGTVNFLAMLAARKIEIKKSTLGKCLPDTKDAVVAAWNYLEFDIDAKDTQGLYELVREYFHEVDKETEISIYSGEGS